MLVAATGAATASAARDRFATAPAPCAPNELHASIDSTPGFVASTGHELLSTVVLTNEGATTCTVKGWPRLALVAPSGVVHRASQLDSVSGAFGAVNPTQLVLQTHGSAGFFIAVPLGLRCAHPYELRIGNGAGPQTQVVYPASDGLPVCSFREQIEVSALHPAWLHLFHDYPAVKGPIDPSAMQRPSLIACHPQNLREVRSAVHHETPGIYEVVEVFFRNVSAGCSLRSRWPVVSLVDRKTVLVSAVRDMALLPGDVTRFGGAQSPPKYLNLARGATALFDILVRDPLPAARCRRASGIAVRFDVTPGSQWSQTTADSYRPAVGIPSCGGPETLTAVPSVSVTPITEVPDFTHPRSRPASTSLLQIPTNDSTGFGWGGDSSGGVCTGGTYPYGVEGLAKYGIKGPCAGFFGQVGAAWSQWPGCPDSGWGWNATDAAEADANYPKYGIGNAFIYFTGGPGMKPPSVPNLKSWADMQMVNFAAQTTKSTYASYLDEPVIILDVETGYGWNDTVTDPTSGTVGCAFPIVTSGTYSAAANKALLAEMVSKASSVFPGYEVVVYTGGKYDWGPWFGSEHWSGGEYTFVNGIAGTPDGATGNLPGRFCRRTTRTPCAQFWGGDNSKSAGALIWQWGSPVQPSTASVDIDQIDLTRFPVHP